jgi:hypothetical protein
MTKVTWHILLFFWILSILLVFKEAWRQKPVLFPSSGKVASNLVGPIDWTICQWQGTIQTVNLWRYTPENRSSPRVVTAKWLLKN